MEATKFFLFTSNILTMTILSETTKKKKKFFPWKKKPNGTHTQIASFLKNHQMPKRKQVSQIHKLRRLFLSSRWNLFINDVAVATLQCFPFYFNLDHFWWISNLTFITLAQCLSISAIIFESLFFERKKSVYGIFRLIIVFMRDSFTFLFSCHISSA